VWVGDVRHIISLKKVQITHASILGSVMNASLVVFVLTVSGASFVGCSGSKTVSEIRTYRYTISQNAPVVSTRTQKASIALHAQGAGSNGVSTHIPTADFVHRSLRDDPSFGDLYKMGTPGITTRDCQMFATDAQGSNSQQPMFAQCLLIFVELRSVYKPEEIFRFDDCEGMYGGEIYSRIRMSETFRVLYPPHDGDMYIIRGFNHWGKCVYYNEWKSQVSGNGLSYPKKLQVKTKTLPTIEVPKMRDPIFKP
jgi:hypothetical protein